MPEKINAGPRDSTLRLTRGACLSCGGRYLDAQALGLQVGQGDIPVVAARLSDQVEVLAQILL